MTRFTGDFYSAKSTFMLRKTSHLIVPRAAVFLLILLLTSISYFDNPFAEAQDSATTAQEGQDANGMIQTFSIDGALGSLITDLLDPSMTENVNDTSPIYVVVGNWSLGVHNGQVSYLQVDFIMGLENGTQMQVYSVENLGNIQVVPTSAQNSTLPPQEEVSNNLVLSAANNYSLSLLGNVDVAVNGIAEWQNVPLSIDIFNGNIISILLDPSSTDNRFKSQPMYGIVTWMLDANNEPLRSSPWAATG
jgi:hypothetical protein